MPVVSFDYNDFVNLLGHKLPKDELVERLPMIGADLDKVEGDKINIEFFPNRPDLASVEGIARASRAFFGYEKGLTEYKVKKSDVVVNVDKSVKNVRPFIATALVKNVTMNEKLVSSLMDLQEKLHFGLGRNREKIAIGVHNFEPVKPPFTYKTVKPGSVEFVPLGKVESMTLKEILRKHEKGMEFAHLLQDFDRYPIIVDSNDNVLSFPPVINGIVTEVTPFTENLFIDVTGTDKEAVHYALNIITTALAERGGEIFQTTVKDEEDMLLPDLKPVKSSLSREYVNRVLGTNLDVKKIIESLEKMDYNAKKKSKDKISVEIPRWRIDILHQVDLIEDVAVGYGFDQFEIEYPECLTFGESLPKKDVFDVVRNIMIGLGFNEVTTFTITNEKDEFEKLGLEEKKRVEIKNPIGEEYSCLRSSLFPSLLKILRENRHHNLPQKIFELGIIVDEEFKNRYHLSFVKIDAKANFTDCKSLVEAVMRDTGVEYIIEDGDHPGFIDGRCASIRCNNKKVGYFGELHPKTITNFDLEHPVVGFEIEADVFNQ